jgi:hypothetical protein
MSPAPSGPGGRPIPGPGDRPIPAAGDRPIPAAGDRPTSGGPARPGDISRPAQGRAGQASVPVPGEVSRPIEGRARPGEVSRPIEGRARPADVSQPLPFAETDGDAAAGELPEEGSAGTEGTRVPGIVEHLRGRRRLRLVALVSLSAVVLVLLPLFFGVRAASRDPVFRSLDQLSVPAWASQRVEDRSSGSRWCFLDCRFRERTAQSERPFQETAKEYVGALTRAGWQPWRVAACPEQPITDGQYSCWRRDEFTLDLWVRLPECAADAVAAQDPATLPSAGPDGTVAPPDPAKCVGSTVSIKVQNALTDQRGQPQRAPDPSEVGETPDPVLSNDPLLDPTPTPS